MNNSETRSDSRDRRPLLLLGIFATSIAILIGVYCNFPKLDPSERQLIRLPRNLDDVKQLARVLSRYKDQYWWSVFGGIIITYIFLQSFAIPGSIFLSILCGYLFPFALSLAVICTCSALGASICYLLSFLVGRSLVIRYFPDKVAVWQMQVSKHRDNLLNYLIFLRITPFLPNWFINIAAPVIDVPLLPFFLGTLIGVAPPSLIAIQTGRTLGSFSRATADGGDVGAFSWKNVALLCVFAGLSLAPIAFRQRLRQRVL